MSDALRKVARERANDLAVDSRKNISCTELASRIEQALLSCMAMALDAAKKQYTEHHDACAEMAGGCDFREDLDAIKSDLLSTSTTEGQ